MFRTQYTQEMKLSDKRGSNLNNSAERIENGGSLSRWYNDDYTRLRKLICLYMLHTHMLHEVSRFSGSAVSKGIKKKLISQPSVNVHTCFFATGITGLFSGLAVSKVEKNKQNKTNQKKKTRIQRIQLGRFIWRTRSLLPIAANLLKTSCDQ